ncbi:MAG: C-GCAxxG-C-C family protein [Candidatus Gastranaerophilaceae bacterium]|nr:C-GCAxxG-C-C family protein [Candidatus Gastranaerophilaceae bacterium]
MSEKSEKAKELFKSGYNCSQAVLGVFCEELGMDFDTAMKLACSFGGGMGRMREVCGTVSGMFMAAGLAFSSSEPTSENKANQYKIVQELANRFREKNGSIICRELLQGVESSNSPIPSERTETYYKKRPCIELVADSVEIFEEYMKECSLKASV